MSYATLAPKIFRCSEVLTSFRFFDQLIYFPVTLKIRSLNDVFVFHSKLFPHSLRSLGFSAPITNRTPSDILGARKSSLCCWNLPRHVIITFHLPWKSTPSSSKSDSFLKKAVYYSGKCHPEVSRIIAQPSQCTRRCQEMSLCGWCNDTLPYPLLCNLSSVPPIIFAIIIFIIGC